MLEFQKNTRVLEAELERFKDLKVNDFKDSLKMVVDELVLAQKKVNIVDR